MKKYFKKIDKAIKKIKEIQKMNNRVLPLQYNEKMQKYFIEY